MIPVDDDRARGTADAAPERARPVSGGPGEDQSGVLVLAAPLAGWATRLDEVPDPAFAQGLIGDGVAIDPISGELRAPCDGVVVSVHRAHHACTLRADGGAEILLHIGVDTVELRGVGFEVAVADGQRVRTGDLLIRFDLDLVSRKARSLHTPVLLVGNGFTVVDRVLDREVSAGDFLLAIARADAPAVEARAADVAVQVGQAGTEATAGPAVAHAWLAISHGLHARPAAAFSRSARQHPGEVTVACRERSASGKSMTSLMTLDARRGDELTISATGPGADVIVRELAALVAAGLGDPTAPASSPAGTAPAIGGLGQAGASISNLSGSATGAHPATGETVTRVVRGPGDAVGATPPGAGSEPTASGLGQAGASISDPAAMAPTAIAPFAAGDEVVLEGTAAAAGLAIGRAVRLADACGAPEIARDGAGGAVEQTRLAAALAGVRRELEQTIGDAAARGDAATREIFGAHLDLLDDPELGDAAGREIAAGRSAGWAWRSALGALSARLRALGNPLLAERTGDLDDLERRTLAQLAGGAVSRVPAELPDGAVLVAGELSPSELAAVPAGRLAGLCIARGGATSHVAILAAGIGVPAVVALGDAALRVPDGAPIVVDGDRGTVHVFPAPATRDAAERAIAGRAARGRSERAAAHQRACTEDGIEIAVLANLGQAGTTGEAAAALELGADGCGLLRTELLFMDRRSAPGEDEQAARYQQIADALQGRPLVIRLLDAGADKPLPYLPMPREDNPALGVRGVRLLLHHPALLRTQLRAILRVRPVGACRIMVPMIASLAELRAVRAVLDDARRAIGVAAPVALGAMIEVPVAALMADQLAGDAEFFSIGTNDLAQYALAIDRGNAGVAAPGSLDPGVLRLVASAVRGASTRSRPVSVCGGAAADPCAVPILLGLGIRTLSVAPAAVPGIKALIRTLSAARCSEIAAAALAQGGADAVRALVVNTWPGLAAHDGPLPLPLPLPDRRTRWSQ